MAPIGRPRTRAAGQAAASREDSGNGTTVEATVDVGVPLSTAYNQWTQFASFPRFMTSVRRIVQLRPNLARWTVGVGPVKHEFDVEIVEQVPDSHIAGQTLGGPSSHRGRVSFRALAPDRTAVDVRLDLAPHGTGRLIGLVPGFADRVVRGELAHFKEFIEALGQEGGAWRGIIRNGHVQPTEPAPPRSQVPHWPVG